MIEKNKIQIVFDAVDNKIDKVMRLARDGLDASFNSLNAVLKFTFKLLNKMTDIIFDSLEARSELLRKLSAPWSLIIPKFWVILTKNKRSNLPIFQPGIHMIRAKVGGGKSLLSFVLAEMELEKTGQSSYFTSPVEKPQLSEDGKYWYVVHQVVDLNDYYQKGKKVLQFNTKKRKRINKDERHLQYPPRMNKSKEYNEKFIVEHEDHLLMRHDGMEWIGMYSQHMKLDSMDMDSITYMHEVSTHKTLPYAQWLKDGLLRIMPTKLKLDTYKVDIDFNGQMERKKIKGYSLKISPEVLARYDTHAEAGKHAGIKLDY